MAISADLSIWTQDTSNVNQNTEAVVQLKMSAFNIMSAIQVVKVMVTVVNSLGETAYDVSEFFLNDPPVKGT